MAEGSLRLQLYLGYGCGGDYREITAIASERRFYTSANIDIQLGTRHCNFLAAMPVSPRARMLSLDNFPRSDLTRSLGFGGG